MKEIQSQLATVTIDASKRGSPISKYVYGQFIEHLGRCIYGGIWAEMLEDRKFYYPVSEAYDPYKGKPRYNPATSEFGILQSSPWRSRNAAVSRIRSPYRVADILSVVPSAPRGGVEQPEISLEATKGYVLRVVASGRLRVSLGAETHEINSKGLKTSLVHFKAGSTTLEGVVKLESDAPFELAAVSLMPESNVEGFRADTLALLKQLRGTIYRWPGGNFVSGYDWHDGLGDKDKRPTRPNSAWTGIDTNDMGIHEFVRLCKLIDAEPLVVVNTGFGDAHTAAEEVEYCNGSVSSPMGALRALNGSAKPFSIHWWGIGNEMYGNWQLGHIPLDQYVRKHNITVDRMRERDPSIACVAVGDTGNWSKGMLTDCAGHMDGLSEHFYDQAKPDVAAHVAQMPASVKYKADNQRKYWQQLPSLATKKVPIVLDEWNYWYGPTPYGELGTRYYLKDGLGIAAGLHEMYRNSDVFLMAMYAQTVNVIGCIKTTQDKVWMESTGLALEMYRAHFGTVPLGVESGGQDVVAAMSADGKSLTVAVINPHAEALDLSLSVKGVSIQNGEGWTVASSDPMAYNDENHPDRLKIERIGGANSKVLNAKPYSMTIFRFPVS